MSADENERKQAFNILKGSASYIRKTLCDMIKLPYSPRLNFILDEGAIHSNRINEILKNLNIPQEDN